VGDKIVDTHGHNHMADPGALEAKKAQLAVVKKAAENPKLKTSTLLEEFEANTEDPSFRTRTVTMASLQRQIQTAKAKAVFKPPTPKSFDDLEAIPEQFQVDFMPLRIVDRCPGYINV
jgi:hypothetical protein